MESRVEAWKKDPVLFVKEVFGKELSPVQQGLLRNFCHVPPKAEIKPTFINMKDPDLQPGDITFVPRREGCTYLGTLKPEHMEELEKMIDAKRVAIKYTVELWDKTIVEFINKALIK